MWLIEDENNEEIIDKQGILNTRHKYIEELYESRNRPSLLDIKKEPTFQNMENNFQFFWKKLN